MANNRRYFLVLSGAASVVILFLFLFSFYSDKTVYGTNPDKIYYADNISTAHRRLIKRFNDNYEGRIKIIPIDLPFSKFSTNERKELFARSLRSKSDMIDVFSVDVIWVPRFARWGYPLDMYFSIKEREEILPIALQSCYYKGNLVAVPIYTDISLMYYRRDLLRRLPDYREIEQKLKSSMTWKEFMRISSKLDSPKLPFYLYAAKNYEGLICSFFELLASQGQTILSGDSVNLNTPAAKKSLQLLVDLVNKYRLTPSVVENYDEFQCYMYGVENDAVFFRGWPGFLKHYRDYVEDTTIFSNYGVAATPHFAGAKPAAVIGGWNLMVSKYSKKKYAAIEFIKFALKPENQKMLFSESGYIPVTKTVFQDTTFMNAHPDLKYYYQLFDYGVHRPYVVDYTKISDVISYYIHSAIQQKISPPDALMQATRFINENKVVLK